MTCGVCGHSQKNGSFEVREMMYGTRDMFHYFECENCQTIQIIDPPDDLSPYYAEGYYAHRKTAVTHVSLAQKPLYWLVGLHLSTLPNPFGTWYFNSRDSGLWHLRHMKGITKTSSILDVGCGSGSKLAALWKYGFRNLRGVDPYFHEASLQHEPGNRLHLGKGDLSTVDGQFDLIMLHHVFEHLHHPDQVLRQIAEHLKPGGWALLRQPIGECYARREYGADWFRLDAPRHLFIHTTKGMQLLAKQAGLSLEHVVYDSKENQFTVSELYKRDIPRHESREKPLTEYFTPEQLNAWQRKSRQLNRSRQGDSAAFYLRKP